MEDLPEELPKIKVQEVKKEAKLREFREYLVEKQVVLAFVKLLLGLRQGQRPENIFEYFQDYFGTYRDPAWDELEQMTAEVQNLKSENASLEEKIKLLEVEIENRKKQIEEENEEQ